MEEPSRHLDQNTATWIKEAGLEKPSHQFSAQVMQRIEAKSTPVRATSLIPRWGWLLIAASLVGAMVFLFVSPPSQPGVIEGLLAQESVEVSNPLKGITLPKTFFYGIGFLALFLIQIPFLKRQLSKNYL